MKLRATTVLVAALLCLAPVTSWAQLATYFQDFEGLTVPDPDPNGDLTADGWHAYVNIFNDAHVYQYGYGFDAPNGGNAASAVVTGQGGAAQGSKQLSIYSNYNDAVHNNGWYVEMNVYQEQTVGAGDVGKTVLFRFDAKHGDWSNAQYNPTALAFIKTLDPNAGYATTNFVTIDMTSIPDTWGTYSIKFVIDGSLEGQILQFGFQDTATHYDPTVIFYDNVVFFPDQATPTQNTTWGHLKSLYR